MLIIFASGALHAVSCNIQYVRAGRSLCAPHHSISQALPVLICLIVFILVQSVSLYSHCVEHLHSGVMLSPDVHADFTALLLQCEARHTL